MGAIGSGALGDGSGTITTGGTAQTIFAVNKGRQYLIVQNVSDEDLWVNFGVAAVVAQPSFKLAAGTAIEFSAAGTGVVPTALVSINGPTTGQGFAAREA